MRAFSWITVASLLTASVPAASLQEAVRSGVQLALAKYPEVKSNQVAVTAINLADTNVAAFRGDVPIYPASVVKLFYLASAHRWMEDGKISDSEELRRAMRDMIVDSSNEATHYVLDLVTGTTGGPELPTQEMKEWEFKRNAVNRYFAELGYTHLNLNQKPWCEGPYGRERAFVGQKFENRNALTTDGTARLLAEIAQRRCVSRERSEQMLDLLKRDPFKKGDGQATDYIGAAVPAESKLWSKAGWTSTARHDAAYVEFPNGRKVVLAIFTTGQSREKGIIPAIAKGVFEGIGGLGVD